MNPQPENPHRAPVHSSAALPVPPLDRLFGRDADLASIDLALQTGTAVLLHGPAGIGKTTLAAALAASYTRQPGGVLWLDLAGDSLAGLLLQVTRAYGAVLAEERPAQIAQVAGLLGDERPLVVLDGHLRRDVVEEFVQECAADVPVLLADAQGWDGPWMTYDVGPLAPAAAHDMLAFLGATALDSEADPLIEALMGHPLSISIAGHQLETGSATPAELLARMPEMTPGDSNRAPGVILAAYRLLPPQVQGMLLLLGSTPAGRASVDLLAIASGAPAAAVQQAMHLLTVRGLAGERVIEGEPYYEVHELVQDFAENFLRGKGQLDVMQRRHLRALITYGQRLSETRSAARLAADLPGLLAVGLYAARSGQGDRLRELVAALRPGAAPDWAAEAGFGAELNWLNHLVGHPQAAEDGLIVLPGPAMTPAAPTAAPRAAPAVEEAGEAIPPAETGRTAPPVLLPVEAATEEEEPEPEVEEFAEPAAAAAPEEAPAAAVPEEISAEEAAPAEAELPEAEIATFADDLQREWALTDEAVTPLMESEPPAEAAPETPAPESFDRATAETAEVDAVPQEAPAPAGPPPPASIPEEIGPRVLTEDGTVDSADALRQLAQQATQEGNTDQAIEYYAKTLDAYHANGEVGDELAALETLAILSMQQGKYEDVLNYIDQGLSLSEEADNPQREGMLLVLLGDLQVSLGRDAGAEAAYQEAIRALRPSEAWLEIGQTMDKLALLYWDQDRLDEAVGLWEQTLPIFERVQRPDLLAESLDRLGDVHAERLEWDPALASYTRALELATASGDPARIFEQLGQLGAVSEQAGRRDDAVTYFRQALHYAFQLPDPGQAGEAMLALGRLLLDDTSQINRVRQLLEGAAQRLPDNTEVQRLLHRAVTRQERLAQAGVKLAPARDSLEDYARSAVEEYT